MSGFELPEPEGVSIEDLKVNLEVYNDRISATWRTDIDYGSFIETAYALQGISDDSETLLESKSGSRKGPMYSILEEGQRDEAGYVTIYGSDYSVSWEREKSHLGTVFGEVGMVLEPSETEALIDFVEDTADVDVSEENRANLRDIAENVVE
jgi:hypothetical protein